MMEVVLLTTVNGLLFNENVHQQLGSTITKY